MSAPALTRIARQPSYGNRIMKSLRPILIACTLAVGFAGTALARLLPDAETLASPGEPAGVVVHRMEALDTAFSVDRDEDGAFRVTSAAWRPASLDDFR